MSAIEQLRRAIVAVILLQFLGVVAAIILASSLSNKLIHPLGAVLVVDYIFITLSAVLGELAAPSENAGKLTTSFVVASSTLAPLAFFVSKSLRDEQKEASILKDITPDNYYHIVLLIAVSLCTFVAVLAALALRRIAIDNAKPLRTENCPPRPILRTGLLLASILLFGGYTFLVNDWKPVSIQINLETNDLVLPGVGLCGLVVVFCSIPLIIGRSIRNLSEAYLIVPVGIVRLLQDAIRSIGPVILAILIITGVIGFLVKNDLADSV
jgi:hypothetical protein